MDHVSSIKVMCINKRLEIMRHTPSKMSLKLPIILQSCFVCIGFLFHLTSALSADKDIERSVADYAGMGVACDLIVEHAPASEDHKIKEREKCKAARLKSMKDTATKNSSEPQELLRCAEKIHANKMGNPQQEYAKCLSASPRIQSEAVPQGQPLILLDARPK
jgi:hypothetical protein